MKIDPQQLKAFLLDADLISEQEFERLHKKADSSGRKLEDLLMHDAKISPEDLVRLEAYILGIPFISLEHEKIPRDVLDIIPEPIARRHNIVAYKKHGKELEVAMLDPRDLETIEFIKKKTDLVVKPRLTSQASMKHVLGLYAKSLEAEFGDIIKKESITLSKKSSSVLQKTHGVGGVGESGEELKKIAEDLPIIRIVDTLVRHAILQKASDIHVEPQEHDVIIRYRIDGILHDAMVLPRHVAPGIIARIKVLASLRLDEHRLPQDGRFQINTNEYKISFRVSVLPIYDGEKVVLRLLPEESHGFTLETLGFHGEGLEVIHQGIKKTVGMILATGPTGSGKTTTLYTVLDILNTPEVNISTIEDPIEYQMPRINQTQVKPDIGFTFANGLRSLVRQDPDIIMVGEIRDNETASLAINAALTGHLVVSTLHTNSAAGAIPRLIDMKVEPFLLASSVTIIIAQRLVRKLCGEKERYFLKKSEIEQIAKVVDLEHVLAFLKKENVISQKMRIEEVPFYKPKPSQECLDGYASRIGIHEVLQMTPTIKELVMKNASSDEIEAQAKKEGMTTMLEDGFFKAVQGVTSIEEVLRVTRE